MRAIIIDDEEGARNVLERLLARVDSSIEILDKCEDLPKGVEAIKAHQPDVVFLDIQMPDYAGYEILNFFDTINFEIIFVTAHDEYAIKAFELSALDYLLKPIRVDRLQQAVDRLRDRLSQKASSEQLQALNQNLSAEEMMRIAILEKGYTQLLDCQNIVAFQAQEAYTKIYMSSGETHLASKHLKHFERNLEGQGKFFRTHKSWFVNLNFMEGYSKAKLEIKLGQDLIARLSKYRKAEFEAYLESRV